jgi:STE24 endopeptidase
LYTPLSLIAGLPLLSLFIYIVHWGGEHFYIYTSVFVVALQLVMMVIYPNFIAPLFNSFTPLPEGPLRSKIFALAEQQHFPCKQLFVMDGSRRHAHSNAYFYGFWKHKRIVLFDTLLQQATDEEVIAIACDSSSASYTVTNFIADCGDIST